MTLSEARSVLHEVSVIFGPRDVLLVLLIIDGNLSARFLALSDTPPDASLSCHNGTRKSRVISPSLRYIRNE